MVPIVLSDNRRLKRNASIAYNYQQKTSIMPAYAHVPMTTYYAQNYAGIIRQCQLWNRCGIDVIERGHSRFQNLELHHRVCG